MRTSLFLCLLLFVVSCSYVTTDAPKDDNLDLLPLKIGNYWVFKAYAIDSKSAKIDSTETIDSLVITDTKIIAGRTGYVGNYYSNNVLVNQYYFTSNAEGIYRVYDSSSVKAPSLSPSWFTISDFTSSDWTIFGNIYPNQRLIVGSDTFNTSYHLVIAGNKGQSTETKNANGTDYQAFSHFLKFDSRYTALINDTNIHKYYNIQTLDNYFERFWLSKQVGFVVWQKDPESISTHSDSTSSIYYLNPVTELKNGWKRELLRYKLN